jgi:dihydroflavonol-4-reductase
MVGRGVIPIVIAGGYDWVDVRDVATGTLLAAEKAPPGEAYLLTSRYLTAVELCGHVAAEAKVRAPVVALPLGLAHVFSYGGLAWELVTGRRALLTPYSVHTLAKDFEISNQKAREQLGFSPRPVEQTLVDAWRWLSTDPNSPLKKGKKVAPGRG